MLLSRETGEEHIVVRAETDKVLVRMPLEEYLIGAMAAVVEPTYETECLKALAILLRGNLERLCTENEMEIQTEEPYFDFAMRRKRYGSKQQEYELRLQEAAEDTKGLVAVSSNHILEGNFHALSAGMTKEGPDSDSVVCSQSVEAEDFLLRTELAKEAMGHLEVIQTDSTGYVEMLNVNGTLVSGEYFREQWQLPSANFEIVETEDTYLITTKGKGHGMGMDLYYANELAKQGYNYQQILNYFFQDFILKKMIE